MVAWPAIIQGVASIGSAIAGGLLAKGGGETITNPHVVPPDVYKQWERDRNINLTEDSILTQMRAASKAPNYGLHPLAALGIQPQYSAATHAGVNSVSGRDKSWASEMGQDISRAIRALKTPEELRQMNADAELKEAQADFYRSRAGEGPGIPSGQTSKIAPGQADVVKTVPSEVISASGYKPSHEAGVHPSQQFMLSPQGYLVSLNTAKLGEALDSDLTGNLEMQGSKIWQSIKETATGLKYPNFSPHDVNKNIPKNYVWKEGRNWFGHKRWYYGPPHKSKANIRKKKPWYRGTHVINVPPPGKGKPYYSR